MTGRPIISYEYAKDTVKAEPVSWETYSILFKQGAEEKPTEAKLEEIKKAVEAKVPGLAKLELA